MGRDRCRGQGSPRWPAKVKGMGSCTGGLCTVKEGEGYGQ